MSAPLVSVIVPVWNGEATLLETLRSAADQTHSNLEILIVDDGSTDSSAEIAAGFCSNEPRARLLKKERGGLASARNRGIDEARGEFVAPLDADDLWHREKVERQVRTFANGSERVAFVYCWYRMIDKEGCVVERPWALVMEGSVFEQHLQLNPGTGSSPMFRRSALGDLRYSTELSSLTEGGTEDWLLQLRLASEFEVGCTPAFLLGYRTRPDSMSADTPRMARSHIHMYEIIIRDFAGGSNAIVERELECWRAVQAGAAPTRGFRGRIADLMRRRHRSVGKPFFSLPPDVP
jgi:glycosyltransferase involved in cell wall biosynthesis